MLSNTIDIEIKNAMLAKDEAGLRGLRAIKAAFLLAKTEKGAAENFNEEAELKVLQKLIKQRKESSEIYQQQGRNDLFQIEQEEIQVIEKYLPAQMSEAEIQLFVAEIIKKTGASSMKDMGKVMGEVSKALTGKADGKIIASVVKSALGV